MKRQLFWAAVVEVLAAALASGQQPAVENRTTTVVVVENKTAPRVVVDDKAGCVCGDDCKCKPGDCPGKCPTAGGLTLTNEGDWIAPDGSGGYKFVRKATAAELEARGKTARPAQAPPVIPGPTVPHPSSWAANPAYGVPGGCPDGRCPAQQGGAPSGAGFRFRR